jgi:hypothetical protein
MSNEESSKLSLEEMTAAREALKERFEKKNHKPIKKTPSPANKIMEKQMQSIRENPLFENLKNMNMEEIKKIIEGIACKMTADSKQKKNIKKQMCELIEKIKLEEVPRENLLISQNNSPANII